MEAVSVDWTTLILGAGLGVLLGMPVAYLIGILSNVHAVRFMQFRDHRKLLKKAKTREQALLIFQRIKAFKEAKRDRYPFYLILASSAVCCSTLAGTLIIVDVIRQDVSFEFRMVLGLLALLAVLLAVAFLAGMPDQIEALNSAQQFLWIFGYITYRDFLDTLHEVRFCMKWSRYREGSNGPFGFVWESETPNEYTKRS